MGWKLAQRGRDARAHRFGGRPTGRDVDQDQVATTSLDERAYRGSVPGTHDAVALPVADLDSVVHLGGSIGDHGHRGQPDRGALGPGPGGYRAAAASLDES